MSELYIKIRLADVTLSTTTVIIDLKKPVGALKKLLCDTNTRLRLNRIILAYSGSVMDDDSRPLHTYGLLEYSMVHVFIDTKIYPKPPKRILTNELTKLKIALQSLKYNSPFRVELFKLRFPEDIGDLILSTPGLNEDVVSRTLLLHPELLFQIGDIGKVKDLVDEHPALGSALLQLINARSFEVEARDNSTQLNSSNDDDMDTSSPSTSSEGSSPSVSRPETITAAQLALAISNVTTVQSLQPSTSGASTSHGNSAQAQSNVDRQLQLMRGMGLTDEAVNRQALELSSDFETAIELVLSGFTFIDNNEQNNQ